MQYQESIKILVFYFSNLIKSDFGVSYFKKLKDGIRTDNFKELIRNSNGQLVTESMGRVYLNLIEELSKDVGVQR